MYIFVAIFVMIIIFIYLFNTQKNLEYFNPLKDIFFIHIPKTAGTSFKSTYNIKKCHHYDAYPRKNKINIAIIRNPYYRFLSIFRHLKDRSNDKKDTCNDLKEYNDIYEFVDSYFDVKHKHHFKTKKLLTWKKEDFNSLKSHNKHMYGCVENYKCIHWAPQSFYIEDPKDVQYLLRFENLNSDIKKLQHLGILPKKDLEKKNVTDSKNIKINDNIIKLVKIIYKDDFKLYEQSGL